ncbi:GNAT family N-acetyltransferase [Halospeciosus flavus]|uniref:GNAT family N-acetyltransferase n=1 Tax=Halospeciosus flavus TaxID=3032283 RepID=A0ABD5Z2H1_9EURY|nr:GNAT family N-acetyltransferase [Halospeciosus flavus]
MEFRVLGDADEGPTLRLDWERFSYAGKFVMSATGKAVACDANPSIPDAREGETEGVYAAVSFNVDRTDDATAWLRYVSVRADYRGEGLGARLCAFAADFLLDERGFERVRIAVNNPYAYHALHKGGFGFTGEETGIAELVLERPCEERDGRYAEGLERYLDRESLSEAERAFVREKREEGPPERVAGQPP